MFLFAAPSERPDAPRAHKKQFPEIFFFVISVSHRANSATVARRTEQHTHPRSTIASSGTPPGRKTGTNKWKETLLYNFDIITDQMKPLNKKSTTVLLSFPDLRTWDVCKIFAYQSYIATVVSEVWGKSGNVDFLTKCAEFETNVGRCCFSNPTKQPNYFTQTALDYVIL